MARRAAQLATLMAGQPDAGQPSVGQPQLRALARRGTASLVGSVVSSVAQLVLVVIVARALPQQRAGLFFSASSLFLILSTVARLGTNTGLVWAISRLRARDALASLRPTLLVALLPVVVVGSVIGAGLLVAARPVADLLLPGTATPELTASMVEVVRATALFVPVSAVYDGVCAATRGAGQIRPTVLIERIGRPVAQVMLVAAAAWTGSLVAVCLAWALPYAAAAVLAVLALRRIVASIPRGPAPEPTAVLGQAFWRFSGPRMLANVAQIVQQRLDIVLVGALRGPRDAAIYAAATRFVVVGQAAALAISLAVEPTLAEALADEKGGRARSIYQVATAWLIVVSWPVYLFALAAPSLILSLFGRGYQGGDVVIRILALTMLLATSCGMVDVVLMMGGRTLWNLGNVSLAVTCFIALDLTLIPRYGVSGAAIGWAVAILINNLVPLAQVRFSLRLHPFGAATLTAMAWAGAACGVLPVLLLVMLPATPLAMAGALLVAGAGYAAGLVLLRRPLALEHLPLPRARGQRNAGIGVSRAAG